MNDRRPLTAEEEDEEIASPQFTRLLIVAFLTAGALGLLCGIAWVTYQLVAHTVQ